MHQPRAARTRPFAQAAGALLCAFILAGGFVAAPASAQTPTGATVCNGPDSLSVDRLYSAYFLRAPDAGGLAYWRSKRTEGIGLDTISTEFTRSPEFKSRYGSLTNHQFVTLIYRNVMGREPDTGGLTHWTGVLDRGVSRGQVMLGFSDSPEYKVRTGLNPGGPCIVVSMDVGIRLARSLTPDECRNRAGTLIFETNNGTGWFPQPVDVRGPGGGGTIAELDSAHRRTGHGWQLSWWFDTDQCIITARRTSNIAPG